MSDRLTRKEIKQEIKSDEVQTFLAKLLLEFELRPKLYLGILAGILALGAAGSAVWAMQRNSALESSEKLGAAIKVVGAPIDATAAKPDDPQAPSFANEAARKVKAREALDKVKSGVAGDIAELYRAEMALEEGDKAKARQIWEAFLRDHQGHALAISVRLNLIELDRAEGRGQEVADFLQKELDGQKKSLPEDLVLYQLALTQESLGKKDDARRLYQRLLDEYPTSAYTGDARRVVAKS